MQYQKLNVMISNISRLRLPWKSFPLAMVLGAIVIVFFELFFTFSIVDPTNTDWLLKGDWGTHYLGWVAYRYDASLWPLASSPLVQWPSNTPILFTDSIPILALLFKPFDWMLPEPFQYIGLALLINFTLTLVFLFLLLRTLGLPKMPAVLAATLLLIFPALIMRIGHPSLTAHWLFLWGMYLCFSKGTWRSALVQATLILVIATASHPYLVALSAPFTIAGLIIRGKSSGIDWRLISSVTLAAPVLVLTILGSLGAFGGFETETKGFGTFSANVLTYIDPVYRHGLDTSLLLDPISTEPKKGQFEGYAYLGAGGILLLVAGMLAAPWTTKSFRNPAALTVFSIAAGMLIFSFSTSVFFGNTLVFKYELPPIADSIASAFRASGRFVWPLGYLLLVFAALWLFSANKRAFYSVLSVAIPMQCVDLSPIIERGNALASATPSESLVFAQELAPILQHTNYIVPHSMQQDKNFFYALGSISLPMGVPFTQSYVARLNRDQVEWNTSAIREIRDENARNDSLYIVRKTDVPRCIPSKESDRWFSYGDLAFRLPVKAVSVERPRRLQPLEEKVELTDLVEECVENCTIIIASQNEFTRRLSPRFKRYVTSIGGNVAAAKRGDAYAVIIRDGEIESERVSPETITLTGEAGKTRVSASAFGMMTPDARAIIEIGNQKIRLGERGLLIAKIQDGDKFSTYHFDTHKETGDCSLQ